MPAILISRREKDMNKSIDVKSLLLGGLLVLLVLCVLGAVPRQSPLGPVGRFTVATSHVVPGDAYVLDTMTGQVWRQDHARGRSDAFYAPKLTAQAPGEPNQPNPR